MARKLGIPQETAQKFVKDSAGQKVGRLPEHVAHKAEGGPVVSPGYPPMFRW